VHHPSPPPPKPYYADVTLYVAPIAVTLWGEVEGM
jgi:hypothetical protein